MKGHRTCIEVGLS